MLKSNQILPFNKQLALCFFFIGVAAISFASMGGRGGRPKTSPSVNLSLTPFKPSSLFTLKAGPSYHGTLFNEIKTDNSIQLNSLITYQKGNTTYILPYKHKISVTTDKSNQSLNLKVTFRR